jgi:hypothetical protein
MVFIVLSTIKNARVNFDKNTNLYYNIFIIDLKFMEINYLTLGGGG